jgi:hypothetical protein
VASPSFAPNPLTADQLRRARRAQDLHFALHHPSDDVLARSLRSKTLGIPDCTVEDVRLPPNVRPLSRLPRWQAYQPSCHFLLFGDPAPGHHPRRGHPLHLHRP